jgi:hypothetical protein
MHAPLRRLAVTALAGTVACAGASAGKRTRVDHSVLTQAQLEERNFHNVLEAVQALRSNWLNERGPDSFISPSRVWVYLDNTRMGGVQTLSQISTQHVSSVRKLSGIEATTRWGLGHAAGVIAVATWPSSEQPGSREPAADSAATPVADSTVRAPN